MLLPPQFRRDDDSFELGKKILPKKKEEQVCKFKEFETKNYDLLKQENTAAAAPEYIISWDGSNASWDNGVR